LQATVWMLAGGVMLMRNIPVELKKSFQKKILPNNSILVTS
jgi:hypothetical protein